MRLKSVIMILLIGSSFTFSSFALKESVDKVQQSDIKINLGIEKSDVLFWIAILFVLGVSILILQLCLEIIFDIRLLEVVHGRFEQSNPAI